jgi:uncharacterized membrane protein YidH (DUF202 family)
MTMIASLAAATAMALVHVFSPRLTLLDRLPRSRWLSAAGGISTAYVFVHLLPELANHQAETFSAAKLTEAEAEVFFVALAGLMTFYGLERWAKSHRASDDRTKNMPARSFWIHLGVFALYNGLIGYLLPERVEDDGLGGLAIYAFAMVLHFLVNDRGLYAHHGPRYLKTGRWVLAVAPFLGLTPGELAEAPALLVSLLLAFLGGGIILNVLKEELPEERKSRFWAFALGAAGYAALLFFLL